MHPIQLQLATGQVVQIESDANIEFDQTDLALTQAYAAGITQILSSKAPDITIRHQQSLQELFELPDNQIAIHGDRSAGISYDLYHLLGAISRHHAIGSGQAVFHSSAVTDGEQTVLLLGHS